MRAIRGGTGFARTTAAAAALGFLLVSCGSGGDAGTAGTAGHEHDHSHDEAAAGFSFGSPGDPGEATRTIEVAANDPFRFDPESVEVNAAETVTFVVSNEDEIAHEFVLGDREYQEAHEEEMSSGAMHHEGNAVMVAPGETRELTWTFPSEGEVLYGCHVAGHYDAGMVGTIEVAS
ncbi:MAG: plastocyanin/azurin family copper-binding protein [Actinomycetota bacterium]